MSPALLALVLMGQGDTAPMPQVEFLTDHASVEPGKAFKLAVLMTLPDHWHTYYANPGESGIPTKIAWDLPSGWKAGPIQWLPPNKIVTGGIPNFGYEGHAVFVTDIVPSPKAKLNSKVKVKAKVSWLLCQEACVPQSVELTQEFDVTRSYLYQESYGLAVAESALPEHLDTHAYKATVKGKSIDIRFNLPISHGETVEFFPADPNYFGASTGVLKPGKGFFDVTVPLSQYAPNAPKRISGILKFSAGRHAQWIDGPIRS